MVTKVASSTLIAEREQLQSAMVMVVSGRMGMDWKPYISTDPQIMHGAVCFGGSRIPVRWWWIISLQAKRLSLFSINTPRFGLSIFPQRPAMQRTWRENGSFPSPLKRVGCSSDLNPTRIFLALLRGCLGRPVTMSTPYLPSNWEGTPIRLRTNTTSQGDWSVCTAPNRTGPKTCLTW